MSDFGFQSKNKYILDDIAEGNRCFYCDLSFYLNYW